MNDCSRTVTDIANSLELRFLIDRHLAARRVGETDVANIYAHAAEGLITAALPNHADGIAAVASRKGQGRSIGSALAQSLSPTEAAAVSVIWFLRDARRPAIDALSEAFRDDPVFDGTIRMLFDRAFGQKRTMPKTEVVTIPPIEMAAAYRR